MKSKIKLTLMIVFSSILLISVLVGCVKPEAPECTEHKFGEWVTIKEPTCEVRGSKKRVCETCAHEESEEIIELGHDEVNHEALNPTCTQIGWSAYATCSRCDYTTYDEIAALGHDEVKHEALNPTCTQVGWSAYVTCSRCNYTTYDEIEALEHDYVDKVCNRCGALQPTSGLKYKLNDDGESYSVVGKGTATDTDIVIATIYEGKPVTGIGAQAFNGCSSSLTSVTNEGSITSIGRLAFYNCWELTSVTLGNSVTSIGECAFGVCFNLTNLTIGDSVTDIGYRAFYGCTDLADEIAFNNVASLGKEAFAGCESLTSVTIGGSLTKIDKYTFRYCTSLTNVTIGNSVTNIDKTAFAECSSLTKTVKKNVEYLKTNGNLYYIALGMVSDAETTLIIDDECKFIFSEAFSSCKSLTSVTIGDSVTNIDERAFNNCTSLTSVTIGNSVTNIGASAFYQCSSLTSVNLTDIGAWYGISFGNYVANPLYYANNLYLNGKLVTELIIPDSVTEIKVMAFFNCSSITSVTIPDSVTKVGAWAFYNCDSLTNVVIPDSVTRIGNNAFSGCDSLTTVTIPDSVTIIGLNAFAYCTSLTNVAIPNSVTTIETFAFTGCESLKAIDVSEDNKNYKSIDGNLYNKEGTELIQYAIGKEDTTFVIPDSVTTIDANAFFYCSSLTNVTIPASLTNIGMNAFAVSSSLKSIEVSEDNKVYKSIDGNLYNKAGTELIQYAIGKEDTTFVVPDSVTSIGSGAFTFCTSLTKVTIPNSVTSIGGGAFAYCSSLRTIKFNGTLREWNAINKVLLWDEGAGDYKLNYNHNCEDNDNDHYCDVCGELQPTNGLEYTLNDDGESYSVTGIGTATDTDIVIASSYECKAVTNIGNWAFYDCNNLTSVVIGDSVTSISGYAFYRCSSLTSVTIGDSVTSIGQGAFCGCSSLTSVTIPDSVRSIDIGAFSNCTSLMSVTIPDSVTSIGGWAFYECTSLTSIVIPNSVTSIDDYAFKNCSSLNYNVKDNVKYLGNESNLYLVAMGMVDETATSLTIDNNCKVISVRAFYSCSSLTSLTIGNSVTSIGRLAFYGCSSLTSVVIPDSITSIDLIAFNNCSSLKSIDVSENNETYKTIDGNLYNKEGTKLIQYAIGKEDVSFEIPDWVTEIGEYAFGSCTNLTSITIGGSVTSIRDCAFVRCSSLTSVTIGETVRSIGDSAFASCFSLMSITIGDSVTSIDYDAFKFCYHLVEVYNLSSLTIEKGSKANGFVGYYAIDIYNNLESESKITVDEEGYVVYADGEEKRLIGYFGSDTELALPTDVTQINNYAFYECRSLTNVTIGGSVTSIEAYAFLDCDRLTSVTIGDSVTSIGQGAFAYCNLTSITIGNSVTSIEADAFVCCHRLTTINFTGTEEEWNAIPKGDSWDNGTGYYTIVYNYVEDTIADSIQ